LQSKVDVTATKTEDEENNQDVPSHFKSALAEALRSKGQLQIRLRSMEQQNEEMKATLEANSRTIKELTAARAMLVTKIKDRDDELKRKATLLTVNLTGLCVLCNGILTCLYRKSKTSLLL
jgi:hypothetical protein